MTSPSRDASWTHANIATNGITLHYVTQGDGPLMLLLHGFPEFWYSWRHQIPVFATHYKVVAVDLRGYNESDKPSDVAAYRLTELIQDVKGVIEGLGFDRCILVGHDWGGAIAWAFAYTYPALVERLIVLNIPHPVCFKAGLRAPQQLLRSWYIFAFQLPLLPEWLIRRNDYQILESVFRGMAKHPEAFSDDDIQAYKTAIAQPGALTAAINYYRNVFRSSGSTSFDRVLEVPTLMIWGEDDQPLRKELSYGTENYVQDFQIRYIPNCSHWVQHDRPHQVNQYIWEFLSSTTGEN